MIDVPHLDDKEAGMTFKLVGIQLPHETLVCYYEEHKKAFNMCVFGGGSRKQVLEEFWHKQAATPWFRNLDGDLQQRILADPLLYNPFRVFGDDVAVTKGCSLLVVTVTALLACYLPCALAKILVCTLPLGFVLPAGLDEVLDILRWSIDCMLTGTQKQ